MIKRKMSDLPPEYHCQIFPVVVPAEKITKQDYEITNIRHPYYDHNRILKDCRTKFIPDCQYICNCGSLIIDTIGNDGLPKWEPSEQTQEDYDNAGYNQKGEWPYTDYEDADGFEDGFFDEEWD